MTEPIAIFLFVIFTVHLLVFVRLTVRHKRSDFLLATVAFLALVLSSALRLWRPEMSLAGHDPHAWLRILAWGATAAAAVLFIRNKVRARAKLRNA
jgi:hypothetical protein